MLSVFLATGGLTGGIITVRAGMTILFCPRITAYTLCVLRPLAGVFAITAAIRLCTCSDSNTAR